MTMIMVRFLKEKYTNIFEERDFFEALIYIFMYGVRCFFDFNIMKIYSIEPNNLHTFNVDKHYFSFLKSAIWLIVFYLKIYL